MMRSGAPVVLLVFVWLSAAQSGSAQGTRADYERAASLRQRTTGKVFRAQVNPRWLPGGERFWYRVEIAPGKSEVVCVDARDGTRRVVKSPSAIPGATVRSRIEREDEPKRSQPGGEETQIRFRNERAGTVRLFWLDLQGKRKPYGEIKPGEVHRQPTYAGHVWLVEDESGGQLGVYEAVDGEGDVVVDDTVPLAKREAGAGGWEPFLREFNVWLRNGGREQSGVRGLLSEDLPALAGRDGRTALGQRTGRLESPLAL